MIQQQHHFNENRKHEFSRFHRLDFLGQLYSGDTDLMDNAATRLPKPDSVFSSSGRQEIVHLSIDVLQNKQHTGVKNEH